MTTEDLDRFEDLIRDLRNERGELESVISRGHDVAREIKSAANTAGEAAGMISMEVQRLRRV